MKRIILEIPQSMEDITLGEYQELQLALEGIEDENEVSLILVSKLCSISIADARRLPADVFKDTVSSLTRTMNKKYLWRRRFFIGKKEYGFIPNIDNISFGEYIDIDGFFKEENSLHKIMTILYRPIIKHRFDTIKFTIKQSIKMANNNVANVFEWYDIEKYDNEIMLSRAESFKQFPAHILLGAVGFFLSNASQYLTHTAYLMGGITENEMKIVIESTIQNLIQSIGAGGGLFTTSPKLIYYQFPGTKELQTSIL